MKRIMIWIAALVLLSGCTASPQSHASPKPSASASSKDPAQAPHCYTLVGKKTSDVINESGSPYCVTGTDSLSDKTVVILTNCDPVNNESTPIYGWYSSDPNAPDQQVYAAKKGGVVVIVPVSPTTVETFGGVPTVNYLAAVGCF